MLLFDPRPDDPPLRRLRERLDDFYANADAYQSFAETVDREGLYDFYFRAIEELARQRDAPVRVLELGAGRTGFPAYALAQQWPVVVDVQDVTANTQAYLQGVARQVFIGDISVIPGPYDFIFHTYVLEHVAAPRDFLEHVDRLLTPGGCHLIACPRYDVPGYVCPSLRHLGRGARLGLSIRIAARRLLTLLGGREQFVVNDDPALFHAARFHDADAVHLVSRLDLVRWHRSRGYAVRAFDVPARTTKEAILRRLLLVNLLCQKPGGSPLSLRR